MIMMTDIKVGDKVRVREDAPRKTRLGEVIPIKRDFTVTGIGKNYAEIKLNDSLLSTYYPIPLKYLIKVEEEKKEAKFKVNDVVRTVFNEITHVTSVLENGNYYLYGKGNEYPEESLTLVDPYTEPTDDEIIRQRESEFDEFAKEELDRVLHPEKHATYKVTIDNVAMDWDAYTADLAKEIALKVANKFNDPEEVADYAVKVAKAVAEGLKKK